MKFLKYIASVRPAINAIFLGAVVSIIVMEGWLNSIPEIVSWGSKFGEVYFKICLSIISSYVFYFIVVHIKTVQDKENIGQFVSGKVRNVIGNYKPVGWAEERSPTIMKIKQRHEISSSQH